MKEYHEIFISLFDEVYVIKVNKDNEEDLKRILKKRPNMTEFEELCYTWKIDYTIERLKK